MDKKNKVDQILQELTKLYIKQYEHDKSTNKITYVRKTEIYKDLLKWFKEYSLN